MNEQSERVQTRSTIITPRELENRNLNSLGEVLQTVPGVVSSKSMDTYKTAGRIDDQSLSGLNIRGYSPSSSVMGSTKFIIDGVEVYDYRALSYV